MDGTRIKVAYLLDTADGGLAPDKVLVQVANGNGRMAFDEMVLPRKWTSLNSVFLRNTPGLQSLGFAVVTVDVPSDRRNGIDTRFRHDNAHYRDMLSVVNDVERRLPGAKVFLAGTDNSAMSAIGAAAEAGNRVAGVIVAGGYWGLMRNLKFDRVSAPVLVVHHVDDECTSASVLDAKAAAQQYGYVLVALTDRPTTGHPDGAASVAGNSAVTTCGTTSRHGLAGKDEEFLRTVSGWLKGDAAWAEEARRESAAAQSWFQEEIVFIDSGIFSSKVETTIFRPRGPGPFPLLVVNHGVPFDKFELMEVRERIRYAPQALEFVKRGFVVAVPLRRGYGRSDGNPRSTLNCNSALMAEADAGDIRAAMKFMAAQPYVDLSRILVAGQSGGGYSSVALSAVPFPGLIGVLNFAGGLRATDPCWRNEMASAYGRWGKTSRVPQIWFYAANDSFFDPAIASASHADFTRAGGRATYLPKPAFSRDGHNFFPDETGIRLWMPDVENFLAELGLPDKPNPQYSRR
jgi:dienelactone hydrolase